MTATMHGIPVHLNPTLPDGETVVWVGVAPLSDLEAAGREARLTVRRGLADVLAWLGEAVENEPTGIELWNALMREANR